MIEGLKSTDELAEELEVMCAQYYLARGRKKRKLADAALLLIAELIDELKRSENR